VDAIRRREQARERQRRQRERDHRDVTRVMSRMVRDVTLDELTEIIATAKIELLRRRHLLQLKHPELEKVSIFDADAFEPFEEEEKTGGR
jgi:hypothetical protein